MNKIIKYLDKILLVVYLLLLFGWAFMGPVYIVFVGALSVICFVAFTTLHGGLGFKGFFGLLFGAGCMGLILLGVGLLIRH